MALHDPISDLLTRIRNARAAKHRYVDIPVSKLRLNILSVLKEQGFIDQVLVDENKRLVRVFLKYTDKREPVLNGLKRISMPGLRRYVGHQEIPRVLGGMGIAILSTPKGVLEGENARKMKLGGELLCTIW